MLEESYILSRWKYFFPRLLNVPTVNDVRQMEMHTAEQLVCDPTPYEVEILIANFENYKLSGIDHISAKLIQAGGEILRSRGHKPTNDVWNRVEFPKQAKEYITAPIYKKGDETVCSNYRGNITVFNFIQNVIRHPSLKIKSIRERNYWRSSVWVPI
jgi:hypothetical protein